MTSLPLAGRVGDRKLFGRRSPERQSDEVVAAHLDHLYRFAFWLSGSQFVAEDLVLDSLTRAWQSTNRLGDGKFAKRWLLKILRRDHARQFKPERPQRPELPIEDTAAQPYDDDTSRAALALQRILGLMPLRDRETLLLQAAYGYSQNEIAEHLGITHGDVANRLSRARKKVYIQMQTLAQVIL